MVITYYNEKEGIIMNLMKRLVKEEEGQGLVEYGLILALIVIVVIVAMGPLGQKIKNQFATVNNTIS